MSNEYTDNHIVPVAYLKRFGYDSRKKRLIGTRYQGKQGLKLFENSVENVGYIKNFYDTEFKDDTKYWEHFFNKEFDTLCGKDLETIISAINLSVENAIVLNSHFKDVLSRIIMSQILRVPSSIDRIKDINAKMEKEYEEQYEQLRSNHPNEKIYNVFYELKFSDEQLKEIYLNSVFSKDTFERFTKVVKTVFG